jgi:putative chitinase
MNTAELAKLLIAVMPGCMEPDAWSCALLPAMERYNIISDPDSVAAFLAQLAVESQELNRVAENLNYKAERLMAVWPKRFPTLVIANTYAGQPEKLANYVYANRMGNGSESSGDGWLYRGRGPLQITGKHNYVEVGDAIGIPLVKRPALLETKPAGALAAARYWHKHKLSLLADDLPDDNDTADFVTITRRINGGEHGLKLRQQYHSRFRTALGLPPQ